MRNLCHANFRHENHPHSDFTVSFRTGFHALVAGRAASAVLLHGIGATDLRAGCVGA
jgi:hypothetical protein